MQKSDSDFFMNNAKSYSQKMQRTKAYQIFLNVFEGGFFLFFSSRADHVMYLYLLCPLLVYGLSIMVTLSLSRPGHVVYSPNKSKNYCSFRNIRVQVFSLNTEIFMRMQKREIAFIDRINFFSNE